MAAQQRVAGDVAPLRSATPLNPTVEGAKATMNERRYDMDWLRVIAMLAIFVFRRGRPGLATAKHIAAQPALGEAGLSGESRKR
jgi:hypothetical protein